MNLDQDALEKVIVNLVGNSLKFTERGGRIEVSGRALEDGGIELVVADTGVGLPADQLETDLRPLRAGRFVEYAGSTRARGSGSRWSRSWWSCTEGVSGPRARDRAWLAVPRGAAGRRGGRRGEEEMLERPAGRSAALGNTLAAMEGEIEFDTPRAGAMALRLAELQRTVERSGGEAEPADAGRSRGRRACPRRLPKCWWSRTTPTCGACSSTWSAASFACARRAMDARGSKRRASGTPIWC